MIVGSTPLEFCMLVAVRWVAWTKEGLLDLGLLDGWKPVMVIAGSWQMVRTWLMGFLRVFWV